MKVSNGLCQSPSFLSQEELGSGYEIASWNETFTDFGAHDYNLPIRENLTMLLLNPVVFAIPHMGDSLTGA